MSIVKQRRAATVGCGRMGAFHSPAVERHAPSFWMPISHLAAMNSMPELTPVACCDINSASVEKAKLFHGVEQGFTDFAEMLETARPEILTIATRTPEKRPILEAALALGVQGVHVEKPLVNTVNDLRALEVLFEDASALMTYGAIRRFLPPYRQAADMIAADPEMSPLHIGIEMGRSPLMWTLIHGIDLILFLAGSAKPVAVQGWFDEVHLAEGCPNHITNDPVLLSGSILFDNGTVGYIGGATGDGVTISGPARRIEILSDGHAMYDVSIGPDGGYPARTALPISSLEGVGGTGSALSLLNSALDGNPSSRADVEKATRDIFVGQWIMFALMTSHLAGGARKKFGDVPGDMRIDGISYGVPA